MPEEMRYSFNALGGDSGKTMELYFGRPIVWSHNGEVPEYLTSHGRTSGELTRYFREKLIKNLRGARRLTAPHVWKGCLIQYRDTFSSYHPIINFLYFGLVIAFTMFLMHPVSLAISLASALVYAVYLNGRRAVRFSLLYMLPMMVVAALVNPAFNHEGATILTYLPSGNPLTLESILYGAAAAAMLAAVVTWFSCYTAVMTSDKFVYLFGRVIPALSLVLSMTLRFVPKFQAQLQVVSEAQRCIGRDVSNGGVLRRLRNAITILSIMVTWSLESAIETADSMKSRGYGLPGRTAFSIYRFDSRDQSALSWLLYCGFFLCCGAAAKGFYWRYYPTARGVPLTPMTVCLQAVYLALCLMPVILNIRADREWGVLRKENEVQPCTKQ